MVWAAEANKISYINENKGASIANTPGDSMPEIGARKRSLRVLGRTVRLKEKMESF